MTTSSDDVLRSVSLARQALAGVPDDGWDRPAGTLTWTCWEVVEHAADDLFAYAAQIGVPDPPVTAYLPIAYRSQYDGGPVSTVFVERSGGTLGLLRTLSACATMLAGAVALAPPSRRAYHPYGVSDASGFAAMGVVEVLVHTFDVAAGLSLPWTPPADLCTRALDRLFPDLPDHPDPWELLLWATGRAALPTHPARSEWRWDGRPLHERA
ncbi:maleylpyruvate isomerase N-terminal domain-containing protein [Dactylosporangium sp. NPDC000521]|uniref:maleylpyruvate isomerase N-terminal domain-containing protein n=1 Tax=Dactylosporangium sp. NPDC000521 TaxID=3363975 RepID=UPI0036C4B1EC